MKPLASFFALMAAIGLSHTLSGQVSDANGRPVSGATIEVVDNPLHASTDAQGRFTLDNGSASLKALQITAPGFSHQSLELNSDESEGLRVTMKKSPIEQMDVIGIPLHASIKQTLLDWAHSTTVATPQSQRSHTYLNLSLRCPSLPPLTANIERAIGTPVQTMAKRTDKQELARLNADNLMFCEDAARNIKATLEQSQWIKDYWFKVEHQESLHAHNAVVIDRKYPEREIA